MTVKCIDISHWQPDFDFEAFSEAGGLAVICKCTEGLSYTDDDYEDNRRRAIEAGLAFASYHFMRPGDMREQARFYIETAHPVDGERVVADHEDYGVSRNDLVDFLLAIQDINPTLQLTIYSGHVIEEQLGSHHDAWLADNTSLWTAQYASEAAPWPQGTWPVWSLWQYTQEGTVAGYDGPVDCNKFNGSDEAMLAWFGPAEVVEEVMVEETFQPQQYEIVIPPIIISGEIVADEASKQFEIVIPTITMTRKK